MTTEHSGFHDGPHYDPRLIVAIGLAAIRRHREVAFAFLSAVLATVAYLCARWAADRPTVLPVPSVVTLLVPAVRLASFYAAGLHRVTWRYASTRDALRLGAATLAGSLVLLALGTVIPGLLPRVLLLEGVFSLLLIGLSRFGMRLTRELTFSRETAARRVLVVGAGTAGNLVIRAMLDGTVRGYRPVGSWTTTPPSWAPCSTACRWWGSATNLPPPPDSCAPRSW